MNERLIFNTSEDIIAIVVRDDILYVATKNQVYEVTDLDDEEEQLFIPKGSKS